MRDNKSAFKCICDVSSIHFVKLIAKIIVIHLSKLFNKCVEFGVFLKFLKYAEVVPNYKSVKKNLYNCRLVSLLCLFYKCYKLLRYEQGSHIPRFP